MTQASTTYVHLAPNPKSSYRQLFIKGTRIRARVLYGLSANTEPMTPEQIAAEYGLPVEAVKEAIAYCQSNPPELLEDYRREEARMAASGMLEPGYREHPYPRPLSAEERSRLRNP